MKTFSNFNSKFDCETWIMIFANKWYDKWFENIWNSKILKQTDRNEKIVQRFEFLIIVTSRFYQIFDVNKNICIWCRMQIYAKYLKSKSLQLIKKLICNQFAQNANDDVNDKINKWWNKQTIENLLFQNLIRNLKCKKSKIRIFECNENINANVKFLQHQIDYTMKRTISLR